MVRVVTDAQRERKRETDRLYREANRENTGNIIGSTMNATRRPKPLAVQSSVKRTLTTPRNTTAVKLKLQGDPYARHVVGRGNLK